MKVRIVPGDFGRYVGNGGSFDESKPDPLSFVVELSSRPTKGEAVIVDAPESTLVEGTVRRIGQVQEVVTSDVQVYVFMPASTVVLR